jgi:hypothetical protein
VGTYDPVSDGTHMSMRKMRKHVTHLIPAVLCAVTVTLMLALATRKITYVFLSDSNAIAIYFGIFDKQHVINRNI